ncbi:putative protein involved in cysteine biosynthesis [Legionella massiliensis]|uniref:Transmembrane protein n=1 Tax=Legionella massiliensis TaxID=1034943 RepID=A0A078L272_9GAMM|nr:hypothetical protein [Legionella massiliensis]CDZ79291.1 putative protein involved in cysteine biosynthesis [Legionella massiliensis]CEE15029.1 hypothetical protein BN1094_03609 [Legionella massiliensis]
MEQDRYQQNSKLFVVGLISLLLCLSLAGFGFYIFPYLIWNWGYDVPELVPNLREWYKGNYNFGDSGASWMVFLTFIIPAVISGFISQWASKYIEKQMYGLTEENPEKHAEMQRDIQETISFGLKIFFLIILVIVGITLVEWLVAPPSI